MEVVQKLRLQILQFVLHEKYLVLMHFRQSSQLLVLFTLRDVDRGERFDLLLQLCGLAVVTVDDLLHGLHAEQQLLVFNRGLNGSTERDYGRGERGRADEPWCFFWKGCN